MRIQVIRTGVGSGQVQRAELDTSARPDAPHLHALAREAVASGTRTPTFGAPGGHHYAITVDGRTVHCADTELSGAQRELVAMLLAARQ